MQYFMHEVLKRDQQDTPFRQQEAYILSECWYGASPGTGTFSWLLTLRAKKDEKVAAGFQLWITNLYI